MLVATFGPSTAWVGKTITYKDEQFTLDGHGPVAPTAIVEYDEQGHLDWSSEGLRQWVREQAAAMTPSPPPPAESSPAEATQPADSPDSGHTTDVSEAPTTAAPTTPPNVMLIATFNDATGWIGRTITREGDTFILEGHGPITSLAIMEYDLQGHLVWATAGTRAWVASLGGARPRPVSPAVLAAANPATTLLATFGPTTAWAGKTITFKHEQYLLEEYGPISAKAVLDYDKQGHLIWATDATQALVRSQHAAHSLTLMWLVAVSPIFLALVFAAGPATLVLWLAPFALLMMDRENLKKAGVDLSYLLLWAILFTPAYCYVRLRRTHQSLGPLYVWILCFVVSLFIPVAALGAT